MANYYKELNYFNLLHYDIRAVVFNSVKFMFE